MTHAELAELERLAKAATPGPWQGCNGFQGFGLIEGIAEQNKVHVVVEDGTYDSRFMGVQKKADAAFIAAANPAVVLSLISRIRELETLLRACVPVVESIGKHPKNELLGDLEKALAGGEGWGTKNKDTWGKLPTLLDYVDEDELGDPKELNAEIKSLRAQLEEAKRGLK